MNNTNICFGCNHFRSEWFGDDTTLYKCALVPGLVTGQSSAFDDDEPRRCERYEEEAQC